MSKQIVLGPIKVRESKLEIDRERGQGRGKIPWVQFPLIECSPVFIFFFFVKQTLTGESHKLTKEPKLAETRLGKKMAKKDENFFFDRLETLLCLQCYNKTIETIEI